MKTRTQTYLISMDVRKRIKMKTMTEYIAGACVCSMRLHHNAFECFSVDIRKRIKTVEWTRMDRCFFDDNGNAYYLKTALGWTSTVS